MGKLKLVIEQLAVESFATAAGANEPGTVHGYAPTVINPTCGAGDPCGTQIVTVAPCDDGGGSGGCSVGCTAGCPTAGGFTCATCTSYDYTNLGGDTCAACMSIYTDAPEHCPCP